MYMNSIEHKNKIKDLVHISIFAIIIAICSYIYIPLTIPITLQTFGVYITCLLLGGKKATISIVIWILLGIIGLPVFSSFKSGLSAIFGPTGGYIIGFIFTGLIMWLFESFYKNNKIFTLYIMIFGQLICYIFGTVWFILIYINNGNQMSISKAISICIAPFILFDIVKIVFAIIISNNKIIKSLLS